ncbi:hypothetical protein HY374_02745 [Candidatus Berkelbacteria bacterium]|nr:hypothetical protein [Candidatus Berkelbacteria bacterium]
MAPRPSWQTRYRTRGVGREQFRNPKIFAATPGGESHRTFTVPRPVWLGLGVAVLVAALGWVLFLSPTFAIEQIDVVGEVTPEVQGEINQLYGKNLLTYSASGMAARLRTAQTSIRDLQVFKGLPRTLRLELALRDPVLAWKSGDQTYLLDEHGIAFQVPAIEERIKDLELVTIVDTGLQPVVLGEQLIRRELVDFATDVGSTFPKRFPLTIDRLEVGQSTLELVMVTSAGWRVFLDTTRQLDPQLQSLTKVFETFHDQIKEYVDLRIEGRAYFK